MHGLLAGMVLHCTKGDSLESHGQPPSLSSGSHRPPSRHLPSGPTQVVSGTSGQGRHVISSSLSSSAKVETKGFSIVRKVSAARRRRRCGTTRRRERFGKRTVETDTYSQLEIFGASSRDLKSRKFLRKLQSVSLEAGDEIGVHSQSAALRSLAREKALTKCVA
jgi:hypothetical protein